MSQVFSGDSVNGPVNQTVVTTTPLTAVTGNFLNPPFQNAKAVVSGTVELGVGSGTTTVTVALRRNPNAENFLAGQVFNLAVASGSSYCFAIQAADAVPDGRPVQYALVVTQNGATGNGTVWYANVTAFLISG